MLQWRYLGPTFPRVSFWGGPYHSCSDGNPTTLATQFWSYLILSDSHTTFYGQWHIFPVRCVASHHAKGSFCLGSQPSLATCKGATVEVVKARCHYCSSKLYLSFGPFETEALYSKGGCARITTLGQPLAGSKMVLSRDCVVKKGEAGPK